VTAVLLVAVLRYILEVSHTLGKCVGFLLFLLMLPYLVPCSFCSLFLIFCSLFLTLFLVPYVPCSFCSLFPCPLFLTLFLVPCFLVPCSLFLTLFLLMLPSLFWPTTTSPEEQTHWLSFVSTDASLPCFYCCFLTLFLLMLPYPLPCSGPPPPPQKKGPNPQTGWYPSGSYV